MLLEKVDLISSGIITTYKLVYRKKKESLLTLFFLLFLLYKTLKETFLKEPLHVRKLRALSSNENYNKNMISQGKFDFTSL